MPPTSSKPPVVQPLPARSLDSIRARPLGPPATPIQSSSSCLGVPAEPGQNMLHHTFLHSETTRSTSDCRETPHLHHSTQSCHPNTHQGCRAQGQHPAVGMGHSRHQWAPRASPQARQCSTISITSPTVARSLAACPLPGPIPTTLVMASPQPLHYLKVFQLLGCGPALRSQGGKNYQFPTATAPGAGFVLDKSLQRKRERRLRGC